MQRTLSMGRGIMICEMASPYAETGGLPILDITRFTRVWAETF